MREFESSAIVLNKGLKRFSGIRGTQELLQCHNLMPSENGLKIHEVVTDLDATATWGGLSGGTRPLYENTVVIDVADFVDLSDLSGVSVYLDDVLKGTTGADGTLSIASVTLGVHDIKLVKTGWDDSDDDVLYNDYITVDPVREVLINALGLFDSGTIAGVEVYLDEVYKGRTGSDGNLTLAGVRIGYHGVKLVRKCDTPSDEDIVVNETILVV